MIYKINNNSLKGYYCSIFHNYFYNTEEVSLSEVGKVITNLGIESNRLIKQRGCNLYHIENAEFNFRDTKIEWNRIKDPYYKINSTVILADSRLQSISVLWKMEKIKL